MSALETLARLRRDYRVRVEDGKLKLLGPKPPDGLVAEILEHREELVDLVERGVLASEDEVFELAREFFDVKEDVA